METEIVEYRIARMVLGASEFIPISKKQFDEITTARNLLIFGASIEEKFDLYMENYFEFEQELLRLSLTHYIFPGNIDQLLDDGSHLLNRRLANLLTTARLYIDQLKHDICSVYGRNSNTHESVNSAISCEYDRNFGYRVIDALRNYVQHRTLPTHIVKFIMRRDDLTESSKLMFFVEPLVEIRILEEDSKFRKSTIKEMKSFADKDQHVGLVPFVREYTESLGKIHSAMRKLLENDMIRYDELLLRYAKKAKKKFDATSGVVAASCNAQGHFLDVKYITDRPTKRRKLLIKKNLHLDGISRRYISSKLPFEDKS